MKIICVGRNYIDHAKELDNPIPKEPIFFLKPESTLLVKNRPFFLPDFSIEIHYEVELVVKIIKLGKNIQEKFAHTYYNEIGIGIDFTARDIQRKCKAKGLPWEISKSFDYSSPLGEFIDKGEFSDLNNINFRLEKNSEIVQQSVSSEMIFSIDKIIEYVSKFMTLKIGDLIYTGTPAGVGPVSIGDRLEAFIEDQKLLSFLVK
ncbi:MAG: fumarylacetoacetate hydrolase family protein [Saprospiraceae bacterium]|nr:fumarylacetoacetate hydrolase family protein [Saprospiraceae bacterium]